MKKVIVFGAGACVAAGAALSAGAGVAVAAPDVVGQTYSDASSAIEGSGGSSKVAVTVGSRLSQDDCIVTNAWNAPSFEHTGGVVMVSLNCDGDHATATAPGASVASPVGREAKAAADEARSAQEQELAEVSTPDE